MIDLRFDHVSKRYRVRQQEPSVKSQHPFARKLLSLRRRSKEFWAVRDVSFEVERGEVLGIIGHNGAGKSTILKLLSGITAPTSGEIMINGRLAALIEVGSGFHPELTGRENVYLSGSILGMRRSEITEKLNSIVDFAGVSEFIHTPVKRYSSGMYVRLGFSIAAHLDPDILLLDEVLAVGDAAFQAKCFERITELRQARKTIVFISHDLHAVERICTRAILMEHGQVAAIGMPREVIRSYLSPQGEGGAQQGKLVFNNPLPNPRARFEVERVEALDRNGNIKDELCTGDYVRFRIVWRSDEMVEYGGVDFEIRSPNSDGASIVQCATRPMGKTDVRYEPGLNSIELEFERFPITAGEYGLMVGLMIPMHEWLYHNDRFGSFTVKKGDYFGSNFALTSDIAAVIVDHRWIKPREDHSIKISKRRGFNKEETAKLKGQT